MKSLLLLYERRGLQQRFREWSGQTRRGRVLQRMLLQIDSAGLRVAWMKWVHHTWKSRVHHALKDGEEMLAMACACDVGRVGRRAGGRPGGRGLGQTSGRSQAH